MTEAPPRRRVELRRLFAAAFAADFALYLLYSAIPYKALGLGADALLVGVLAALTTGAYAVFVNVSGRASDRVPRLALARAACMGVLFACIGLTLATKVTHLLLFAPVVGASVAFFWPCLQASIADRSPATALGTNLGRFNLAWSFGKGCGFVTGGVLLAALGPEVVFTAASLFLFVIFFVLPSSRDEGAIAPAAAADGIVDAQGLRLAERFRRLAWLANGAAYGVAATLTYHYPRLVQSQGWTPRMFGVVLGGVYFTQTLVFYLLMRHTSAWRFRRLPLFLPQILVAAGVLALPLAAGSRLVLIVLVFGLAFATCYAASIYYSLYGHAERGRNAGVHELLIGVGGMAVPLLGGLATRSGLGTWGPYVVAAVAVLVSVAAQQITFARGRGSRLAPVAAAKKMAAP